MPSHDHIDTADIRGRNVIDNRGKTIGTVEDVSIDPTSWRVRGLVVQVERDVAQDVNLDRPMLTGGPRVEIGTERINALGENIILNLDTDDIASLLRRG